MTKLALTIGYLYGESMNIYGDTGNITALTKRAQWRGINATVKIYDLGSKIKEGECDLFFFGGGQDAAQSEVTNDLKSSGKARLIKSAVDKGVPLLSICGGYQLLGEYYQPFEGPKLMGVGLFPAYTKASNDRMIGNIIVEPIGDLRLTINELVGFENHSGKTYLKEDGVPLGKVIKGFGNNGEDKTEGCIYKNAIGCYMHGSLLPKNPDLADWLLQKALEVKYGKEIKLDPLDDSLESSAHRKAVQRFS